MAFLEMSHISKRYGGVQALRDASLSVERGEVHGLLGPNGSGKSTVNKVLAGTVAPDTATIVIDGVEQSIGNPRDAHRAGVAAVYQQLSLIPELTVGQNMVLGAEAARFGFVTRERGRAHVEAVLERFSTALGDQVHSTTKIVDLSTGQQQIVEIAKAVMRDPRILVLDEATASLHRDQVETVFEIVRELANDGVAVIFVSHRLNEVFELCDRATILRSGQSVTTVPVADVSEDELVRLMVGDIAAVAAPMRSAAGDGAEVLRVEHLHGKGIEDVSFTARAGEVVGLGGLQGQGQTELLLGLFGSPPVRSGTIAIGGVPHAIHSPRRAAALGIALVPGDREKQGLFAGRPILENIASVSLRTRVFAGTVLSIARERTAARSMVEALQIKIGSLNDPVTSLSGGNQQKVVLAKWLLAKPSIVLLDDPTKGVDIAAKAEIYAIIRQLIDSGATVIFNSSDDRELETIADRVLVMYEGTIRRELTGDQVTYDTLVSSAMRIGMGDQEVEGSNG